MMKTIAVLIALMLVAPALAFPDQPWGGNPDICKIQFDAGDAVVGIYVWFNNDTQVWEAKTGIENYRTNTILPFVWKADRNGLLEIDATPNSGYY